jgi:formylglycine-generating enzyme required for sulfatase activity
MNGIRYRGVWARLPVLGVLGVVVLFAACGQRGSESPPTATPLDAATVKKQQQENADALGVDVEITNSIGMKLALIPAGEFMMGSPESEKDRSSDEYQHKVRITKPFYLGVYEVTQAEYEKVMGENPSGFKGAANPVEQVSWDDANEFCRRLSAKEGKTYRLPTEAEWEYACRAGSTTPYSFGHDAASLGEYAWYGNNSDSTHPVGEKKGNAWGLHDMHGNVWEWCQDWYDSDYYRELPVDDPQRSETASGRVLRGGYWAIVARYCRAACRYRDEPQDRGDHLGFRVAAVPPGGQPSSSR